MLTLVIDTTTQTAKIGLAEDNKIIAQHNWEANQRLAEELVGEIEKLLSENKKTLSRVENILVHSCPGGFSTLRIGVTAANTLGFGLGISVSGIEGEFTSLEEMLKMPREIKDGPVKPIYMFPPRITISNKPK
jgi:tRNA threonylcarbamoyl adenosine modification protein YeaZ